MSKKIEWEQFFVWNKKKFKLKSKLCFLPSITYFPYLKNNIAQFHISRKVPSINDITHLGGRGICQKVMLLHKLI